MLNLPAHDIRLSDLVANFLLLHHRLRGLLFIFTVMNVFYNVLFILPISFPSLLLLQNTKQIQITLLTLIQRHVTFSKWVLTQNIQRSIRQVNKHAQKRCWDNFLWSQTCWYQEEIYRWRWSYEWMWLEAGRRCLGVFLFTTWLAVPMARCKNLFHKPVNDLYDREIEVGGHRAGNTEVFVYFYQLRSFSVSGFNDKYFDAPFVKTVINYS